jgi:biopolymer transport protein ExbD
LSDYGPIFGGKHHSPFGGGGGGEGGGEGPGVVDLNLTPLMDVMSNILFFLLAAFGSAIIGFLAASVPVQAEENDVPDTTKSDVVTANLQINNDGYKLAISNDHFTKDKLDEFKISIPKKDGQYDTKTLNELLFKIKTKYTGSDTIMIVPSERIIYADIIGAMEAAKDTRNENRRLKMFPKAVIADIIRAE